MEAKFCPQCGTPRLGNFCGKCGFNFQAHQTGTAVQGSEISETNTDTLSHRALPKGLIRGEKFNANSHCDNCGLKLDKNSNCKECGE